jgi:hypothetical protein
MRAPLLVFALVALSACTQSNVQLPPFYEAGPATSGDSGEGDASEDSTMPGSDATTEAATDAPVGDGPSEAASEGGTGAEGGTEAGPSDAGDGGG